MLRYHAFRKISSNKTISSQTKCLAASQIQARTLTQACDITGFSSFSSHDEPQEYSNHYRNSITVTGTTCSNASQFNQRNFSSTISSSSSQEAASPKLLDERNLLLFDTLHDLQTNASNAFSDLELFGTYKATDEGGKEGGGGGKFEWMTYEEFGKEVSKSREVLKQLGVQQFSKVGIISNNRWEWAAISCAAYSISATVVPMYEAQLSKDWLYILNDSECTALFCATKDIYDRVNEEVIQNVPSLQGVLCFEGDKGEGYAFSTMMEQAASVDDATTQSSIIKPSPSDLANLIYTSGTTGVPKGVELTHSNHVSNLLGVRGMVPHPDELVNPSDRSLAFLPWAHSYGQTCELWWFMAHGASMGVGRGVPYILEDLQLVKPTTLFSVPTLYKRVYDGVMNIMSDSSPLKQKLMKRALELGRANSTNAENMGFLDKLQFKLLDAVILKKIRDRFGGNLRQGYCAGAACPKSIVQFMDDIGISISEGYGLTETSPVITINAFGEGARKVGSVGKPIVGVNVVIVGEGGEVLGPEEEGEICCYGPNVMKGYHQKQDETKDVMSLAPDMKSRLFHTGDLGRLSKDNFLFITGRLKELYKLENGKYICPTPVEESIGMSRFIMQVVLCGANRPYNIVLIVPDWNAIQSELKLIQDQMSEEDLVNDERVAKLINLEIQLTCSKLKKFETPKKWAFVAPFTAGNNMLTPKMSIRRHMVINAYEDLISRIYDYEDGVDCGQVDQKEVAA